MIEIIIFGKNRWKESYMRRLKLIKVVVPEIVAYFSQGEKTPEPEYQCACGMGVAKEYKCCPYCGAELAWNQVRRPSKEFRQLLDRL